MKAERMLLVVKCRPQNLIRVMPAKEKLVDYLPAFHQDISPPEGSLYRYEKYE